MQQQPPGYQPQYPQQGQPQYGQMPYYPQQKKGIPGWAWVLIICGVLFVLCPVVAIFGLAAIPLFTSNTRDARRAEGEQMLGSMKGQARVAFAKTATAPIRLTGSIENGGADVFPAELEGMYFRIDDSVRKGTQADAMLTANPKSPSDGVGTHEFDWASGEGTYSWR